LKVTDVLGTAVPAKLLIVKAYPAADDDKVLISNQEIVPEGGAYKLNFFAAKPEPGFYKLEFKATPEKSAKAIAVQSVVREIKVLTTASVIDAQLVISDTPDSQDLSSSTKHSVEQGKSIDRPLDVEDFQTLVFNFKLRNQAGKALTVQQAFLRISNDRHEAIAVSKISGKFSTAQISMKDIRSQFLGESGLYTVELIVGDSFIQNPFQWKIASVNIKFGASYEAPEDPFAPRTEIAHLFRLPEVRPPQTVSMAFTIACSAPILVLLIGLLRVGANTGNFPSGTASMYALGFHACIGAILGLFALYWLQLNMMQTLRYLLVLSVPTLFFGVKTLNAVAYSTASKTKKE